MLGCTPNPLRQAGGWVQGSAFHQLFQQGREALPLKHIVSENAGKRGEEDECSRDPDPHAPLQGPGALVPWPGTCGDLLPFKPEINYFSAALKVLHPRKRPCPWQTRIVGHTAIFHPLHSAPLRLVRRAQTSVSRVGKQVHMQISGSFQPILSSWLWKGAGLPGLQPMS